MRMAMAISGVSLALVAFGCGGDDVTTVSGEGRSVEQAGHERASGAGPEELAARKGPREYKAKGPFATVSIGRGGSRPKLDPPNRPPPGGTLVRNLEIGTGPVARRGDLVVVHYVGINYKTGKKQYGYWPPDAPIEVELTFDTESKAWEETIEGMKVGGLREMIIPSRVLYGTGTIDYVLELMRVEQRR
jgi:peptidylprolyl isomerase